MKTIKNHILTSEQLSYITKVERFQGAFEATKFQRPALIDGLKKTTIITSSGSSTRIEGAILTDAQVEELMEKGCQITRVSSRSEREVAGHIKALTYIYDNYEKLPITEKNIRELHDLLTSELTEDQLPKKQRGAYKDVTNDVIEKNLMTGETKIWFQTTPPGPETATAMEELISSYNQILENEECHPITMITGFIIHFLAIHPFRDGNGRLSRLLTSLLLLRHGYKWSQYVSHEKIIEDNKEGYYIALRDTQSSFKSDKPNYDKWADFFLKIVTAQTEILQSKIIQESPISIMNENEKLIYKIIETNGKCKIAFLLEQTDMTRPGLKSLLKRLVENGVLKKEGQGKGTYYFAP
jgi:Fic family protein